MPNGTNCASGLLTICICAGAVLIAAPSANSTGDGSAGSAEPGALSFTLSRFTHPEAIAFMMMRKLDAMEPGVDSYEHRQKIKQWQIRSHERWRKVGSKWMRPRDFIRLRNLYERQLGEVKKAIRKAKSAGRKKSGGTVKNDELPPDIVDKLRRPAQMWADPLIEDFLLGIVEQQKRSYPAAITKFAACCEQAPRIAAFHQARAMALLGMDRSIDALAAATMAMKLRPEKSDALNLVRRIMQTVPGSRTGDPVFASAAALVAQHAASDKPLRKTGKTVRWLMPRKNWSSRPGTLPIPSVDRFVFRQAIGVPVSEDTLVSDSSVVTGALELFVRIDSDTLVPCKVRRSTSLSRGISVPLATVIVPGCAFTPVELAAGEDIAVSQDVTAYGLGIYEQMGRSVRRGAMHVKSVDPNGRVAVSGGLLAGEGVGPVLTGDGKLLGFLGARTDVTVDGGGPNVFADAAELAGVLKRIGESRSRPRWIKDPDAPPVSVEGNVFIIYATFGEKFE